MVPSRSEEEILAQAPLRVMLGGETYEIKPLVIAKARPWRARYTEAMKDLQASIAASSDTPEDFKVGIETMFVSMPDTVIGLFFEYAVDLDKEAIEKVATEYELGVAFKQVMDIAFPLVGALVGTRVGQTEPEPPQPTRSRADRRRRP